MVETAEKLLRRVESTAHGSARLAALGSSWEEISLHGLLTSFTRSSQKVPEEMGSAASKLRSGGTPRVWRRLFRCWVTA